MRTLPRSSSATLLVLGLALSLAGCASGRSQASTDQRNPLAAAIGYRWQLTQVNDTRGVLAVPPSADAEIAFASNRYVLGDDTMNPLQGQYRLTRAGYSVRDVIVGGVGSTGNDPVAQRTINAVDAVFLARAKPSIDPGFSPAPAVEVTATVHANVLTLRHGNTALTLTRHGRQRDVLVPPPSATPTATPTATK